MHPAPKFSYQNSNTVGTPLFTTNKPLYLGTYFKINSTEQSVQHE